MKALIIHITITAILLFLHIKKSNGQCQFTDVSTFPQYSDVAKSVFAVKLYDVNGNYIDKATGVLINNTNNDGTPYALISGHLLDHNMDGVISADEKTYLVNAMFQFNYLSATQQGFTLKGADFLYSAYTYLASYNVACNDWVLIKLKINPISSCNDIYYAGWKFSNLFDVSSGFIIHHAGYLSKKVSETTSITDFPTYCGQPNMESLANLKSNQAEGHNSSGGPLFNYESELIRALLSIGVPTCNFLNVDGISTTGGYSAYFSALHSSQWVNVKMYLDPSNKLDASSLQKMWPGASPGNYYYSNHALNQYVLRSSLKDLYITNVQTYTPGSMLAGKSITLSPGTSGGSIQIGNANLWVSNIGSTIACTYTPVYKELNDGKPIIADNLINNKGKELLIYPNPFNSNTTISYTKLYQGKTEIQIYNRFGQLVKTLLNEEQEEGEHLIPFDTENLAPGLYFCIVNTDDQTFSGKMLIVK